MTDFLQPRSKEIYKIYLHFRKFLIRFTSFLKAHWKTKWLVDVEVDKIRWHSLQKPYGYLSSRTRPNGQALSYARTALSGHEDRIKPDKCDQSRRRGYFPILEHSYRRRERSHVGRNTFFEDVYFPNELKTVVRSGLKRRKISTRCFYKAGFTIGSDTKVMNFKKCG